MPPSKACTAPCLPWRVQLPAAIADLRKRLESTKEPGLISPGKACRAPCLLLRVMVSAAFADLCKPLKHQNDLKTRPDLTWQGLQCALLALEGDGVSCHCRPV